MAVPTPTYDGYYDREAEQKRLEELERLMQPTLPPPGGIIIGRFTSAPAPVPERRELKPGDKFRMNKKEHRMIFKDNEDTVDVDVIDIYEKNPVNPLQINNLKIRFK